MIAMSPRPDFSAAPSDNRVSDSRTRLRARLKGAGLHLAISISIALLLILLVTKVWYPAPLFELVQGRDIFFLIVGCDITLGPAMTLVILDIRKPRRELVRDVAVIACVQLAALSYGIYALAQVRPAYIVFNVARFNVTLANELVGGIDSAPDAPRPAAPWTGPRLVGARLPRDAKASSDMIFSALHGRGDVFQIPSYFVPYQDMKSEVIARAQSVADISKELVVDPAVVERATASYRQRGLAIGLLPLVLRQTTALAVIDINSGELLGIEPIHRDL